MRRLLSIFKHVTQLLKFIRSRRRHQRGKIISFKVVLIVVEDILKLYTASITRNYCEQIQLFIVIFLQIQFQLLPLNSQNTFIKS